MKKTIKEMFLYLIVGGIATVVEWVCFYVFNNTFGIHYLVSTIFAYIISTFSNWLAGKIIMFKETRRGLIYEILSIYAASIIGLIFNLLIMWVLVELISANEMFAKIIATGLVFVWNFLIRKFVIYRKNVSDE